jgi:predicted nuclease with TOPRIM domain
MAEPRTDVKPPEPPKPQFNDTANVNDKTSSAPQPEDDMQTIMQKVTKSKDEYLKAEEDITRLEGELAQARETRTKSYAQFSGLKDTFNKISSI